MKLTIDTDEHSLSLSVQGANRTLPLYSREAFEILSREWLRVAWNEKYPYTFTWMGRPIIQLPDDMMRIQEVIWALRPHVIVETGVAHGGSLIFYAGLCALAGRGKVIGVDIEIRPQNREAIQDHPMAERISLIEGSSIDPAVVDMVRRSIEPTDTVLVLLDSCHTRDHVLRELESYAPLVTVGSYIVATDGFMKDLHDVPRGTPSWVSDHPTAAAAEFAAAHSEFILEQPPWLFNESRGLTQNVTYWPGAWLRRICG